MKRVHITAAAVARSSSDSRADNCGQRVENIATVIIGDGSSRQSNRVTVDIICLPTTAGGTLTITKYTDDNANGRRDNGEQALVGWSFEIRNVTTGQIRMATTGTDGSVLVGDLDFGLYAVRETGCAAPCDFTKWLPISYTVGTAAPVMGSTGNAQITIDSAQQTIAFGNRLPRLPSTSTDEAPSESRSVGSLMTLGLLFVVSRLAWRKARATH
jgi:hypothetical protein